jgi:translocation and assembly module TamA
MRQGKSHKIFAGLAGLRSKAALAALILGLNILPAAALDRLDVRVAGGDADLVKTVEGASFLRSLQAQGQTDPQDLLAAARADYGRILAALYARGHYSGVIRIRIDGREAAEISPLETPASIRAIEIAVDPGPPFRFGAARIAPLPAGTDLPPAFRTGEIAASGEIADAVALSILAWREVGHAKAEVGREDVIADHDRAVLDVGVGIDPGPRLRFGTLTILGAERMREQRVRKIAGLPTGEVFSESELSRAENRLRRTGIFSSVNLREDEEITAPDLLGISASIVEQKPRRYSVGAEVASLDGVSLTGTWLHRNLLGGGERFQIGGKVTNIGSGVSGVDYSLSVSIDRPATLTPDTTAGLVLSFSHQNEIDYSADVLNFGLVFTHVVSERLTATAGLTYSAEEGTDPGGDFSFRNLSVPTGLIWDRRDDPKDATGGTYLQAAATPFLGFGTTGSGLQAKFDARAYRSFGGEGRFVLALRAQGGAVFGPDLLETPRDLLFFSGGGGSVRGQPYRSLGIPVTRILGPEFQIGGQYFLGASVELRAKVTDRIGLVGFVDAGSIGLDGILDGSAESHAGAGLGLRYDTGFGPIRLDVAAPISGRTGDGVQIYIGLGQAF